MRHPLTLAALAACTALCSPFYAGAAFGQALPAFGSVEAAGNGQGSSLTGTVMVPFALPGGDVAFVQVTGTGHEDDSRTLSFGAGLRQSLASGAVLGLYGFVDSTETALDNRYEQISFGAELLATSHVLRANVYLPVGDGSAASEFSALSIIDNQLVMREGFEATRRGADVEAGYLFESAGVDFGLYGGAYWLEGMEEDLFGASTRFEIGFNQIEALPQGSSVRLGAYASYDELSDFDSGVSLRLTIPLGGAAPRGDARMVTPVERTALVRTEVGALSPAEDVVLAATGQRAGQVVALSGTSGTAAAINAELAAAGSGALILGDGAMTLGGTLQLAQNQYFLGGGGSLEVTGVRSGVTLDFVNRGAATVLTGTDATQAVLGLASGSVVDRVAILGGSHGIEASDVLNAAIRNADISQTAADGIRLYQSSGIEISDTRIHDLEICQNNTTCEFAIGRPNIAPNSAISAVGVTDLTIRDVEIHDTTYGIFVASELAGGWPHDFLIGSSDITIENVTIRQARREGIMLVATHQASLTGVTIENVDQDREMDLVVLQGASNVTIEDMYLRGGVNGLMLITASTLPDGAETTNVRVNNLTVEDTRMSGVFFNPVSGIELSNVTINNAGTNGMFLYGSMWGFGSPLSDIGFENVVINAPGETGMYFGGDSENFRGGITINDAPKDCVAMGSPGWLFGSLTQDAGTVLAVNGTALDQDNFETRCAP